MAQIETQSGEKILTIFPVAGFGRIDGEVCFCEGHLCNSAEITSRPEWVERVTAITLLLLLGAQSYF